MRAVILSSAVLALTALAAPAWAVPVNWTVNGTFNDGGTVSGTFTYDADTNTFSAINVTTTAGGLMPGATYVTQHPFATATQPIMLSAAGDDPGDPVLAPVLAAPMTNAGGVININPGPAEGTCTVPACGAAAGVRNITVGTYTGVAAPSVPTLGEWAMIGMMGVLAMFGVATLQRRRRFVRA